MVKNQEKTGINCMRIAVDLLETVFEVAAATDWG